jgi:hypothetical protein
MRRREFVGLVGGAAAWPVAARAQQPARTKLVGVLETGAKDDPAIRERIAEFQQGLAMLGSARQDRLAEPDLQHSPPRDAGTDGRRMRLESAKQRPTGPAGSPKEAAAATDHARNRFSIRPGDQIRAVNVIVRGAQESLTSLGVAYRRQCHLVG